MSQFDREKWDAKYAVEANAPRQPSQGLLALEAFLPQSGRALEIAAGGGRHAIWLAERGLEVTAADISPVGLAIAARRARQANVSLRTLEIDLEQQPFPAGPWDVILSVCYLQRELFAEYPRRLALGGRLIVIQPTVKNLERHAKPPRDFLLAEGELRTLAGPLEVLHYGEGWSADDRHDAVLVAERG